jgi:pimeloyl-ACP methyl ester carboxylesterase
VDIHLERAGRGPAILWIHGYTMDRTIWYPLWDKLPGFRHCGVDLPGHGRSGPIRDGETLAGLAARIMEVAAAEGADQVVGLSFGSAVALQLAISYPQAVRRLVVAAPAIAGALSDAGAARREIQLTMLYRIAGPGPHMTKLWMTSPPDIFRGTESHPPLRERLGRIIDGHRWAELKCGAMRSLVSHVHTDADLGRVTAATLVITGDQDMPAFLANASRLAAVVPRCDRLSVPEAGHLCLIERPDEVAGPLRAHLAAAG